MQTRYHYNYDRGQGGAKHGVLPRMSLRGWRRGLHVWLAAASITLMAGGASGAGPAAADSAFPDRFVWVFGWNLSQDAHVREIGRMLETAARHGLNGAVASFGLDTLCRKDAAYFRRLNAIRAQCRKNHLELIPSLFSVGYGGSVLAHDPNLAEGFLVKDALFVADGREARFVPEDSSTLVNGGFESWKRARLVGYNFHDEPGKISFRDTRIRHGGKSSVRFENFTANPHGHGRVMQEVRVRPHRCYRVSLWVKTEGLEPQAAFQMLVLAGSRSLAPQRFRLPATTDWRKVTFLFNSLGFDKVRLYAGVWGGRAGRFWLDDWSLEEVGPINVLHRPGTPVVVRDAQGATTYQEGRDYAPLVDPHLRFTRVERPAPVRKLLPGTRIRPGQRLRVSYYHGLAINGSQVTVCMAEPKLYEVFDHEAGLLAKYVHPQRVLLSMDEIRMGGTCAACRGRNMGELLGECITRQVQILRRHLPGVEIYIWSDMLDPNHNAHGDYYLVQGDFTGSWDHVPKDLIIAVWGGRPRPQSLRFFADRGFRTLIACYYDADDLKEVRQWLELARATPRVRGLMYTPWRKKYDLLPAFGDLLSTGQ